MHCLVHIGSNKTGSSSIQALLARHKRLLVRAGILYPLVGRKYAVTYRRHLGLSFAADPGGEYAQRIADRFGEPHSALTHRRHDFEAALAVEIAGCDARLAIFSDEGLFKYANPALAAGCIDLLASHFDSIEVMAYVRAPDRYCESTYVQAVKTGATLSLDEYVGHFIATQRGYAATLDVWADVVGPGNVRVVPFPETGDVVADFLSRVGMDASRTVSPRVNSSPDWTASEALRLINLAYQKTGSASPSWFRQEVERRYAGGSPPRLTATQRQAVRDAFRNDHQRLVDRYFGGDASQIYTLPRTVHETDPEPPVQDAARAIAEELMAIHRAI